MKPHNTRVSRTEPNKRVLLRQRCGQLAIPPEVTLIEYLDRIFMLGRSMLSEHHLLLRSGTYQRTRKCIDTAERTVEYEPSPKTFPNSKSSAVVATRPFTELLRDWLRERDRVREAGGRRSEGSSSRSSERPSSRAR